MRKVSAILLAVVASALLGCIGVVSRSLMGDGMDPLEITASRFAVVAVVLGSLLLVFDRRSLRIGGRDLTVFLLFGTSKVLCDVLLFISQSEADLSVSALLLNTAPYYVMAVMVLTGRERFSATRIMAVVLGFSGCVLVSGILAGGDATLTGLSAGASAGLMYAAFTIGGKVSSERGFGPVVSLFYMFLFGTVVSVPAAMLLGDHSFVLTNCIPGILIIGVLMTLVPFLLDLVALESAEASAVSLAMASEMVFAAMAGLFFFDETVTFTEIAGIAVFIVSLAIIGKAVPCGRDTS